MAIKQLSLPIGFQSPGEFAFSERKAVKMEDPGKSRAGNSAMIVKNIYYVCYGAIKMLLSDR